MHLLAAIVALTTTANAPLERPATEVQAVTWSVRGISHTLRVRSDADAGLKLIDRPHEYLRSVVGPMVSTLMDHSWTADNGGYRTLKVVTEYQGKYQFDLIGYLDASGQSGPVLAQLLQNRSCLLDGDCTLDPSAWPSHPHCPSAKALNAYDGGFVEMANMLVTAECFASDAVRIEPESFWVESWNGEKVTMAVQRDHCEGARSACGGAFTRVELTPPPAWKTWLDDANAGKGYLPVPAPVASTALGENALGIPAPEPVQQ